MRQFLALSILLVSAPALAETTAAPTPANPLGRPALNLPLLVAQEVKLPPGIMIYRTFRFKDGPGTELERMTSELYDLLVPRNIRETGPMYLRTIHSKKKEDLNLWVVEAGVPIARSFKLPAKSPYKLRRVRGGTIVRVVHRGPRESLPRAYEIAEQYIKEHGLKRAGDPWESLLTGSEVVPPAPHTVAVAIPVKK